LTAINKKKRKDIDSQNNAMLLLQKSKYLQVRNLELGLAVKNKKLD
jgi:hypothetical protein